MYEVFEQLLKKYGVTAYKVSKETGVTQSTLSDWKNGRSKPKTENLKKIADYFGVTLDFLMTGDAESTKNETKLMPTQERDIAKDVDNLIVKMKSEESGPALYNGIELSDQAIEIFRYDLEVALNRLRMYNKKKLEDDENNK